MANIAMEVWVVVDRWLTKLKAALHADERGQGMVEYGLILALVSVVALAILYTLGSNIRETYKMISDCITAPAVDNCPIFGQ
jgi:pilus assembly protein Flp/PilA